MHQCQAVSVHVHNINYCWTEWTPLLDQQWLMYYNYDDHYVQKGKQKEEKKRERSRSPKKRRRLHHRDHEVDKRSRRSSGKFDMYNEFIPFCFN